MDLIDELRGFATAYPEDIFLPLTDEQTKEHAMIITRASAEMGRHMSKWTSRAADRLEELERLVRVAEEALADCCTRMERARSILKPEGNWAMLDTALPRAALAVIRGE